MVRNPKPYNEYQGDGQSVDRQLGSFIRFCYWCFIFDNDIWTVNCAKFERIEASSFF